MKLDHEACLGQSKPVHGFKLRFSDVRFYRNVPISKKYKEANVITLLFVSLYIPHLGMYVCLYVPLILPCICDPCRMKGKYVDD
jgi:hypothetical protein